MATTLTIYIPNSNDEKLFVEVINNIPSIDLRIGISKYPFYTFYWEDKKLYVRKRIDVAYAERYKKLLSNEIAALALLPKKAIKSYLFSI